jgi:hypothetical protein
MFGPLIGYGCDLTVQPEPPVTTVTEVNWYLQPYADFEMEWNLRLARESFPLLKGGIDTPDYLMLVVAAGPRDGTDPQQAHVTALGNFAVPLAQLVTWVRDRLAPRILTQTEQVWAQVVATA